MFNLTAFLLLLKLLCSFNIIETISVSSFINNKRLLSGQAIKKGQSVLFSKKAKHTLYFYLDMIPTVILQGEGTASCKNKQTFGDIGLNYTCFIGLTRVLWPNFRQQQCGITGTVAAPSFPGSMNRSVQLPALCCCREGSVGLPTHRQSRAASDRAPGSKEMLPAALSFVPCLLLARLLVFSQLIRDNRKVLFREVSLIRA